VPFDPLLENQRAGLALVNGKVYVSWGSHADRRPYHGWVMGFSKSDLSATPSVYNASPNGFEAGIWMSGGAPAVDADNNLYVMTGNGLFDGNTNFSDSFLKLSTSNGLTLTDWMVPADQTSNGGNDDLGAGGTAVLADLPSGPVRHLVMGGGKKGQLFVLDRDAMGHVEGSGAPIVQKINLAHLIFATGAFWQNNFYIAGSGDHLKSFPLDTKTGQFDPVGTSTVAGFGFPGATPSISANGASNGIVWALNNRFPNTTSTVLLAFNATNLTSELWNSTKAASNRDQAGGAVKFTVPTVANGKVYVGTSSELDVYGLLPD